MNSKVQEVYKNKKELRDYFKEEPIRWSLKPVATRSCRYKSTDHNIIASLHAKAYKILYGFTEALL